VTRRPARSSLKNLKVLVTAGPTREPLDPVRFLTNASSGKMGYALAAAARKRGARVTLVSGPTALDAPKGVRRIDVSTAREMLAACLKALPGTALVIGAAAVADFQSPATATRKIKKSSDRTMTLRLVPTPDVIAALSRKKRRGRPVVVGFALETEDLLTNAFEKMERKGLDAIVANGPDSLDGDVTRAALLTRGGDAELFRGSKAGLAERILNKAETLL
jgi:phosphopantothenoylcysteine decarboxylase/phosphopantothenate--cysteine ligase